METFFAQMKYFAAEGTAFDEYQNQFLHLQSE